jgi:prevent-host-death family protein
MYWSFLFCPTANYIELGVIDEATTKRFSQGSKHLIPEEYIERRCNIESKIRQNLDNHSLSITGFAPYRWVPVTSYKYKTGHSTIECNLICYNIVTFDSRETLMSELTVGVRDLKSRLSTYLRKVKQGQTIVITDHNRPVGRILPIEQTLEQRILVMREAGMIAWNGENLQPITPAAVNHSVMQVSDLLIEMRE